MWSAEQLLSPDAAALQYAPSGSIVKYPSQQLRSYMANHELQKAAVWWHLLVAAFKCLVL
jgi:hypothetical protein